MSYKKLKVLLIVLTCTFLGCSESVTIGQLDAGMTAKVIRNPGDSDFGRLVDAHSESGEDAGADAGEENEETLKCDEEWSIRKTDGPMLAIWGSQKLVLGSDSFFWDIYAVGGTVNDNDEIKEMPRGLIYNKTRVKINDTLRKSEWNATHYYNHSIEYPVYGVWGIALRTDSNDPLPHMSNDVIVVHRGGADRRLLTENATREWREEVELNKLFTEDVVSDGGVSEDGVTGEARPILTAVDGSDSENIFVVGSREWVDGTPPLKGAPRGSHIAHYDGTSWSLMDVEPSSKEALENAWLTDIWYDSEQQRAFAISSALPDANKWNEKGASAGAIFEYNNEVWRQVYPTSKNTEADTKYFFFGVWGSQKYHEVFVVGSKMEPPDPGTKTPKTPTFSLFILRLEEGEEWQQEFELPKRLINQKNFLISGAGIWGDGDDVYVVGTQIGYRPNWLGDPILKDASKASKGFMVHYDYNQNIWYWVRYPESEAKDGSGSFPFGLSDIWGFSNSNYHLVGANGIMNCINPLPQQ